MADKPESITAGDAGWSKNRRNGNDDVPTDRNAVKIIRPLRTEESDSGSKLNSKTKSSRTKIAKLIYEPKTDPTKVVVKSVHSFVSNKKPEVLNNNNIAQNKAFNVKESNIKVNENKELSNRKNVISDTGTITRRTEDSKRDYIFRKQERQNEVEEIQKMLSQINNFTNEMSKEIQLNSDDEKKEVENDKLKIDETGKNKPAQPVPILNISQRSKTDIDIPSFESKLSISSTPMTRKSKRTTRSTSTSNIVFESVKKKKSYDPELAKQFMEEQKKKRKEMEKISKVTQTSMDREAIKKRLEELRKSTLKILDNNLKKAKKKVKKPEILTSNATQMIEKNVTVLKQSKDIEAIEKNVGSKVNGVISLVKDLSDPESENLAVPVRAREKDDILIKKTDNDELNVSQLKKDSIDKEHISSIVLNLTSNNHNPQVEDNPERDSKSAKAELEKVVDSIKKTYNSEELENQKAKQESKESIVLSVPKVTLKTKVSHEEKSVQVDTPKPQKPPIPYWLKPTPVQIYPYNFIMAVRKKLEAIANPVLMAKKFDGPNETNIGETPLIHEKHNRQKSVKRKLTNQLNSVEENGRRHKVHDEKSSSNSEGYTSFPSSSSKKFSKIFDNPQNRESSQKSSSAAASNFSSISMHLPVSNTISEISSIRSEGHHNFVKSSTKASKIKSVHREDDTTVSSSVFSSPEKRLPKVKKQTDQEILNVLSDQDISPLSVDNISKLQIKSKAISEGITTVRRDESDQPIRSDKCKSSEEQRSSEKSDTISEFEQLLEDFNKSLTQVIEVNHQIKTALSNTPRLSDSDENNLKILPSSVPKKTQSVDSAKSKPEDYSSDFEEAASTSDTKIKISDMESDARSIVSKNIIEEEVEESINSKSNSNSSTELKSNESTKPKFISATKKSSGTSISTQMSDFTTRQKEPTENESQLELKPLNSTKSVTPSHSFASEEFLDSIEEISKMKILTLSGKPNIPEVPEKSINPENMPVLQFSKTLNSGVEEYSQVNFFQGHVNVSRGDFMYYNTINNESSDKIPPAYATLEHQKKSNNSSLGSSDIFAIFNQSDIEMSMVSRTGSLSETTLNYSSLGLYEQLLQAENNKSDQLLMLLKMREKALIDRTKGQIAWLQVQKEKYKAKGLTLQISAIKKKQRAILLKMEREREEIKKMLQSKSNKKGKSKLIRPLLSNMSDMAIRKSASFTSTSSRSTTIVRGQELQPNQSLEKMLQKREEELKKRRTHVEHLIEWHKRLDKEEEEVLQMEQMLLDCNLQIKSPKILKKQKRIEDIDNSLKELQNISNKSDGSDRNSHVRATGQKLNKLWKRLTGLKEQKFEPNIKYKLSKTDLEELYEEAKITVLRDFGQEDEMKQLLDLSKFELTSNSNKSLDLENKVASQENNISSGQSDMERVNSGFEKMNGFESIREDKVVKEIESGSSSTFKGKSDTFSNIEEVIATNELTNEYIDTFEVAPKDKTYTTTAQEDIPKRDSTEELQKESESSSQPSDSSVAKTESVQKLKAQSSDSDRIDTIAEITSLSYDSNNSFENTSKLSGNIIQTSVQEDYRVVDSDVDSIHPLTVISNKHLSSEEENQQRSSVIISRVCAVTTEEGDKKNVIGEPVETETPSLPENSEEHYSESFISYDSHQDSAILEKVATSEVTHSSTSQRNSSAQVTPILSNLIETIVDEGSQEEKADNEHLEKSSTQESIDYTLIEDISLPRFESTAEESNSQILEDILPSKSQQQDTSETGVNTTELEKRLIDLDVSLKELDETFERALSPDKSPSPSHSRSPSQIFGEDEKENMPGNQVALNSSKQDTKNVKSNSDNAAILMPDIINEVEIRRRQHIILESDLKQLEHAVPYVFLREIPNKPPPPYVPPAHGSPMTTIFPPESRIQEITYRRVRELYEEMSKTEINNHLKRPSIMGENITNIYERIILDICKEMMQELQPTLNPPNPSSYKNLLALFNPPNRLNCLQDHIYKHIRKLLAMDKRNQRKNSITAIGHKKRDPVDEILIQELYEEEDKWINFDLEEAEVKEAIVEEIFNDLLKEALDEIVETNTELIEHTEKSVDL